MSTEPQAGGVEWEAAEALKLMVLGMVRFSEALRNGASAGAAEQLIPMLLANTAEQESTKRLMKRMKELERRMAAMEAAYLEDSASRES